MCGLVGIASSSALSVTEKDTFTDLLFVDTVRGDHSTGIFTLQPTMTTINTYKAPLDGPTFLSTKKYDKEVRLPSSVLLAGHNRYATKGAHTYDNAHPFIHDHVVLMHNGTLRTMNGLKEHLKFGTDSEAIAYNLSLVPPEEAKGVISQLNGAFALVWYDLRDGTLNFIRNSERELYVGQDKTDVTKTITWASEEGMLQFACTRKHRGGLEKIELLKPMHHYKVSLKGVNVDLLSITKYEEYTPPKYHGGTVSGHNNWGGSSQEKKYLPPANGNRVGGGVGKGANAGKVPPKPSGLPKRGEIIAGLPVSFSGYGHDNNNGKVVGFVEDPVNFENSSLTVPLEIHNIPRKTFEAWEKKELILCKVVNTNYSWTEKEYIVYGTHEGFTTYAKHYNMEEEEEESTEKKSPNLSLVPKEKSIAAITEKEQVVDKSLESILDYIPGPDQRMLTLKEFNELTKGGCALCTTDLFQEDIEEITWEDSQTPLCGNCSERRKLGEV